MLRLTIPEGIDRPVPVLQGRPLEPGAEYLCHNRFVGQLLLSQYRVKIRSRIYPLRTLLKVQNYTTIKPLLLPNADWNRRDLWFYRGGGWGDLLAMTPVIQQILARWPKCRIHVACGSSNQDLFRGLNVSCELIPVPFQPHLMIVDCEELVEGDPDAEQYHLVELFARRAGIKLENPKIHYSVTLEEFNEAC